MFTIFTLVVLLFSLVIHEVSHGLAAEALGDNTAKDQGRLSLNPLKHLDPFGSVLVPLLLFMVTAGRGPLFGWAKPVPVNPYNFKDQKWGLLKVSLAGPAANFLVAVFFSIIIRVFPLPGLMIQLLGTIILYNLLWGFFNLVPFPPLDGSSILFSLLPEKFSRVRLFFHQYGPFLLVFFVLFGFRFLNTLVFSVFKFLVG